MEILAHLNCVSKTGLLFEFVAMFSITRWGWRSWWGRCSWRWWGRSCCTTTSATRSGRSSSSRSLPPTLRGSTRQSLLAPSPDTSDQPACTGVTCTSSEPYMLCLPMAVFGNKYEISWNLGNMNPSLNSSQNTCVVVKQCSVVTETWRNEKLCTSLKGL